MSRYALVTIAPFPQPINTLTCLKVGYRLGEEEGYVKWDEKLVFEIQFNGSWRAVCCRSKSHTGTDASLAHALGIYFAETVLEQRLWDTSRPTAMVTVIE